MKNTIQLTEEDVIAAIVCWMKVKHNMIDPLMVEWSKHTEGQYENQIEIIDGAIINFPITRTHNELS